MATYSTSSAPANEEMPATALDMPERPKGLHAIWLSLRKNPLVIVALIFLVVITTVGVLAELFAPFDPEQVVLLDRLQPPGFVDDNGQIHWLGTDNLGRDVLSRLIFGARISLMVGSTTVIIGGSLGLFLGLMSGYFGSLLDDIIMRLADIQLAFPNILLYIAVLSVLGSGLDKVVITLGFAGWVTYARVARGEVFSVREREYVEAARSLGGSDMRIIRRHIVPNILAPVIVVASFEVARNIIVEASLSFLGLGVPPSIPSWGAMLAESRDYIRDAWWPVTFPGLAIMMLVLSINIVGDWLRDYLDPRLKK